MVKRSVVWMVIGALLASIMLIAWLMKPKPSTYKGPFEDLSFGNTPVFYSLLPLVAEERGLFTQNGLRMHIREYEYGALAMEHLLKGEA